MFEYIHVSDVRARQILSVPKMLLGSPAYEGLSIAAKVLYALLCDRIDQQGHGMASFEPDILCIKLNCLSDDLDGWLNELEAYDLIQKNGNAICVHPMEREEG